jgi:hypothetical protein
MALGAGAIPAFAGDPCVDFKWDVSQERALFAAAPLIIAAGRDAKTAPVVEPKHLYQVKLESLDAVAFPVPPGKTPAGDKAYAGVAVLRVPVAGSYRIALDMPLWVDVVSGGSLLPAKDFQGQRDCIAPHKIVEFDLQGATEFMLQFSSAASQEIRLTVTPSPSRQR